jgi:dihydrofolate reductase
MSKELILHMSMSADGFVAGPNGEFDWVFPGMSDEGRAWVVERFREASLIAMGRKSYEAWINFWPTASSPIAHPMNELPKVVFSRSGVLAPRESVSPESARPAELETWLQASVAGKDLVADIQRLKAEDGKPIVAVGGASFASSLVSNNLVDVYRLVVHPVLLGRGISLFGGLETPVRLQLAGLKEFPTGVVVKTYRSA